MFEKVEKFIKRAIHAVIILFASAILFFFGNITIPINTLTIAFSIILGLPGVFLIVLFGIASHFFAMVYIGLLFIL